MSNWREILLCLAMGPLAILLVFVVVCIGEAMRGHLLYREEMRRAFRPREREGLPSGGREGFGSEVTG